MLFQWFGMLQVREMRFHYSNGLVVLRILRGSIGCKKCVLLAAMLLFHSCFFTHSINQGWANLFTRRVICKKTKTPCSEPQNQFVVSVQTGAQPELHFGEGNFQEISFDDVIMLTQPWYNVFANGHRYNSVGNNSENENFSVLIKMQTEPPGQSKNQ